jgi:hypothetical protein
MTDIDIILKSKISWIIPKKGKNFSRPVFLISLLISEYIKVRKNITTRNKYISWAKDIKPVKLFFNRINREAKITREAAVSLKTIINFSFSYKFLSLFIIKS